MFNKANVEKANKARRSAQKKYEEARGEAANYAVKFLKKNAPNKYSLVTLADMVGLHPSALHSEFSAFVNNRTIKKCVADECKKFVELREDGSIDMDHVKEIRYEVIKYWYNDAQVPEDDDEDEEYDDEDEEEW